MYDWYCLFGFFSVFFFQVSQLFNAIFDLRLDIVINPILPIPQSTNTHAYLDLHPSVPPPRANHLPGGCPAAPHGWLTCSAAGTLPSRAWAAPDGHESDDCVDKKSSMALLQLVFPEENYLNFQLKKKKNKTPNTTQKQQQIPNSVPGLTSSWQCMRAMASDRRIMLSNCRTVILHDDFPAPEQSRWRRCLYSSIMYSWASLLICTIHRSNLSLSP